MDLQKIFDNMNAAHRAERMANSAQLTLGEVITKLESITNKGRFVHLDFGRFVPRGLDSWRGSYAELALGYDDREPLTVGALLDVCRKAVGETFTGYKGGEFRTSRHTPVWVANYGRSGVDDYHGSGAGQTVAVVDIAESDNRVVVVTAAQEY